MASFHYGLEQPDAETSIHSLSSQARQSVSKQANGWAKRAVRNKKMSEQMSKWVSKCVWMSKRVLTSRFLFVFNRSARSTIPHYAIQCAVNITKGTNPREMELGRYPGPGLLTKRWYVLSVRPPVRSPGSSSIVGKTVWDGYIEVHKSICYIFFKLFAAFFKLQFASN